jgi:hypothetical protein
MTSEEFLQAWMKMADKECEALLPQLLEGMRGWRVWATDPGNAMFWLTNVFEKANISMYDHSATEERMSDGPPCGVCGTFTVLSPGGTGAFYKCPKCQTPVRVAEAGGDPTE